MTRSERPDSGQSREPKRRTGRRRMRVVADTRQPAPTAGRRAVERTERILDAAMTLFRTRGYGATSVDAIAAEAETSRASVYTYFGSKRDILITLGARGNERFQTVVDQFEIVFDDDDPEQALDAWVEAYLDFLDYDGSFNLVWTEAAQHDEALRKESVRQYSRAWQRLGTYLVAEGGPTPAPDTAALRGMLLVAAFERSWYHWHRLHVPVQREALRHELVALIMALRH